MATINKYGYRVINGRLEHIMVMERILGGPIPKGYHVHHKNRNRVDNRPENLELLNPIEHTLAHRKLRGIAKTGEEEGRRCAWCNRWVIPSTDPPQRRCLAKGRAGWKPWGLSRRCILKVWDRAGHWIDIFNRNPLT